MSKECYIEKLRQNNILVKSCSSELHFNLYVSTALKNLPYFMYWISYSLDTIAGDEFTLFFHVDVTMLVYLRERSDM